MKIAVFAIAALLSGCATAQLDKGLRWLVDQNIHDAVAVLGYPDTQREVMGDTIYIWSTNRQAVLPLTTMTTTTGTVGGTPYYGQTTGMNFIPVQANCTIQIATTPEGTIKSFQWEGNEMGCQRYARGFQRR